MTALDLAEDGHEFAMNRCRPTVKDRQSGLLLLPMLVPLGGDDLQETYANSLEVYVKCPRAAERIKGTPGIETHSTNPGSP